MAKQQPALSEEVDKMKSVTIYASDYCMFCHSAKALLAKKGLSFNEINVDSDRQLRQVMTQKSGRTSVPQIWIGEKHIGGCDDLYALERSKQLDVLLNQE